MTLGEFLQAVLEWFYELWPFRIVREWEQGVRLRNGNVTKLLTSTNGFRGSGVHTFWPMIGEILSEEVNVRVIETSWQTLVSFDDRPVSFSLAARYKIRDLSKLYISIHDQEETIQNQLSAAAALVLCTLEVKDLDEQFAAAVEQEARKKLSSWGVTLLEVNLYNRVEANALRLLSE